MLQCFKKLTLIWVGGGGGVILPPCWLSLNNSETVKALTLTFCSIKDVLAEFGIHYSPPVSRYWANVRRVYFRFPDFWSIPYKKKLS